MASKGTVLVNLRNNWFGPDGSLYEAVDNPHEFPAEWAEPQTDEPTPVKETVTTTTTGGAVSSRKYAVLPSSAEVVESQDTVAVVQNTGGGQRVLIPQAVEDGVESVGGAIGKSGLEEPDQSVTDAAKVAEKTGLDQVGGKPSESGPLPAGTKKPV